MDEINIVSLSLSLSLSLSQLGRYNLIAVHQKVSGLSASGVQIVTVLYLIKWKKCYRELCWFQISLKVARDEHQKQEQLHLDEKQELLDRIHEKDVQYQVKSTTM